MGNFGTLLVAAPPGLAGFGATEAQASNLLANSGFETTNIGLGAGHSYTLGFHGLVAADETSFIDNVSIAGAPEPAA